MEKPDNAGVRIPPPLYFLSFLALGIWQSSAWVQGKIGSPYMLAVGTIITVVGAIFLLKSVRKHETSGTNVEPWKPTTALITDGLHKYSRNPIYVAMAVTYLGIAIAASSLVAIVLLFFCLLLIRIFVIAKEEAYLEDKFGEEYLQYKEKVRRWI
ncbi:isoprenylcysteine carboxylmethyltransferase family protein [Sneathiella marina]|uniref:Isoprenylcysteine carboxylmethyltransferase family protein n=1 Tax=Sneathiella marina TaxID=2950108 RepID=A0ABY4W7C9_9PROT|nr:isoprenylcysteine carboxylmethyltransferase family protein [Sneathiella marina]USG61832.1 isoprenylcysteine carboxylmethyltransferase family protein [Sneathiella marina]